jgi:hypothetical protein
MSTSDAGGKTGSESRKRRGLFLTLWRAWWVRNDEELSAEDAASTLFRFFRSKHVGDLRIAASLALILLLFDIALVSAYSYIYKPPIANSPPSVNSIAPPNTPPSVNSIAPPNPTEIEKANSVAFWNMIANTIDALFKYAGPAITICGAIVAWAYVSASKRLGIIDLFACEISTLCRVGTIFDIGKIYAKMYSNGTATEKQAAAKDIASSQFISQEQYFPIFEQNSSDLESLEALVVESITEYYTYMKAMRDLLRKLASIEVSRITKSIDSAPGDKAEIDPWHQTVSDIIYVLFLGYESARKAITDLTEFQPTRAEHIIAILLTELVCYSFLCKVLKDDNLRFSRLQLRLSDYENVVPELIEEVNSGYHGNQRKYWAPAQRTIAELKARYIAALDSVQQCAMMNNAVSREVSVTMRHHDKPIAAAIPGSTVMLEIQVQNKGLVPLRYSWTSPSAKLADSDKSSVALTLPRGPQETVLFVEVTNEEGGAFTASVAIPLANGPASQDGPVLKILFDNGCL